MLNEGPRPTIHVLRTLLVRVLLGLAPCLPPAPALAEVYRWVGPDGVTVYSRRPPPDAPAAEIREAPAPSAEDAQRSDARVRALVEQEFDQRFEAQRAAEEAAKQSAVKAQRQTNCAAARRNLEALENLGTRMVRTPDGEYLRLSEADREARMAEARGQIEQNCD